MTANPKKPRKSRHIPLRTFEFGAFLKDEYPRALRLSLPNVPAKDVVSKYRMCGHYTALCRRRRIVSSLLAHAGLVSGKLWWEIDRCPPFDIKVFKAARSCKQFRICPFCWQRFVTRQCAIKLLRLLDNLPEQRYWLPGHDFRDLVVELSEEDRVYPVNSLDDALAVIEKQTAVSRCRIPDYALGAQSLIRLIPRPGYWMSRRSLLTLADCHDLPRKPRKNDARVMYYRVDDACLNRDKVVSLIGKACQYPPEWLSVPKIQSDFHPLAELMTVLQRAPRTRFCAFYGKLRQVLPGTRARMAARMRKINKGGMEDE